MTSSQHQFQRTFSTETLSSLEHTKKLLDPSSYRNYLSQQSSRRNLQSSSQNFQSTGGFEGINFNVSPLDVNRQPVYQNFNFDSRNFGNLCDRVFREQSKQSQRQKFGVRDKEEAKRCLETQQKNLQLLKESRGKPSQQLNSRRMPYSTTDIESRTKGFVKKVVEIGEEKLVIMLKSFEVIAIRPTSATPQNKAQAASLKKRISTLIPFHDMHYLMTYFTIEEITQLFQKFTYVHDNTIRFDYVAFAAQPRILTDDFGDKPPVLPERISEKQHESTKNVPAQNAAIKFTFKVEFPHIEFYISELAHKQKYFVNRPQVTSLSASNFDDLNDFVKYFDFEKLSQVKQQMQFVFHEDGGEQNDVVESNELPQILLDTVVIPANERLHTINEQSPQHNGSFEEGDSDAGALKAKKRDSKSSKSSSEREEQEEEEVVEVENPEVEDENEVLEVQQFIIPEFTVEDRENSHQENQDLAQNMIIQNVLSEEIEYIFGFKSLEVCIDTPEMESQIVKQFSFLELYNLIMETSKNGNLTGYIAEVLSLSPENELIVALPDNRYNEAECLELDEQNFIDFIDQLQNDVIEINGVSYNLTFMKPSIEVQESNGSNSAIIEVDGNTLQNIVQRGFNFSFVINS